MTNNKGCSFSNDVVSYMLGEVTEEEKSLFEEHILNCVFCRLEVQEMEEAWNVIPLSLDDVAVPTDLKEEVMNYIFQSDKPTVKNPIVRFRKFLYVLAAAIILVSFAGLLWNNLYLKQELAQLSKKTISPTDVVQVYSLKSTNPEVNLANGNAWVYKQGARKQIVFKLRGLATTKGTEA